MENLIKRALYTSVGIATTARERLQKSIDEIVEKGKISELEGKKIIEDFRKDTENTKDDLEDKLKGNVEKVLSNFELPTIEQITKLEERVAILEKQLAAKKTTTRKPRTKAAAKKTTAKKETTTVAK